MDPAPGALDPRAAPPALLCAPQAEVLEDVLREQFGPLPQLAAVCRLKRLPSGGYSSTENLQLVLERRRVANAKERERVRGPQGRRSLPPPTPCFTTKHLVNTRGPTHRPPPLDATSSSRGLPRPQLVGRTAVASFLCTSVQLLVGGRCVGRLAS